MTTWYRRIWIATALSMLGWAGSLLLLGGVDSDVLAAVSVGFGALALVLAAAFVAANVIQIYAMRRRVR
jgi:hypothetical protein